MADKSYDAIVVGGGHHGTIIACYLQKAGLSTVILERQAKIGGSVTTAEGPIPGFTLNEGAHWGRFWSHPSYRDFNLKDKGLNYIFPENSQAMIFDNGTCLCGYSALRVLDPTTGKVETVHQNIQKTLNEIARFSKQDAGTAEELIRRYTKKWRAAFHTYRNSPPTPWGVNNALEELFNDPKDGIDPVYRFMTSQQIAYDLFESDYLRTMFMRTAMTSNGVAPWDVMSPYCFMLNISLVLSMEPPCVPIGGTGNITKALQKAFTEMGGKSFTSSEVAKLIIENGKATGVRLKDKTEIKARKLVVSDLSAEQTVLDLIGEDNVDPKIARRVKNIRHDRHQVIWANYAVHELPVYKAACFNPDCGTQPRLYIGPRNPEYLANKYYSEIFVNGIASRLYLLTSAYSMWDKSLAPEGKHIIGVEEFSAPTRYFTKYDWERIKSEFTTRIVDQWSEYAPNMNRNNVIAARVMSPLDLQERYISMREGSLAEGDMIPSQEDRFRPIPELSGYRMPINNVYLCSAAAHGGVGTGRGSSYSCYQVIAKDFGLPLLGEKK